MPDSSVLDTTAAATAVVTCRPITVSMVGSTSEPIEALTKAAFT